MSLAQTLKRLAPGPTAMQSLALWGGVAGITAFWLTQPTDWIKKQLGLEEKK